jgi:spoIIIJ-associated protein
MRSLEVEAKTIEEAIEMACSELNVSREKVEIEVLSSGSTGIFGIVGTKKAKIRVTTKEESSDLAAAAEKVTKDIISFMGLEATLTVRIEGNTVHIQFEGDKSSLLIGRRGQTLDALQYILTRILHRQFSEKVKIILDSGDYRDRRKRYLEDLAVKMAEKSKQTGKPVVLSPMNAHDRRIIHMALEKDKSLKTISRGDGLLKKIIISTVRKDRPTESASEPSQD